MGEKVEIAYELGAGGEALPAGASDKVDIAYEIGAPTPIAQRGRATMAALLPFANPLIALNPMSPSNPASPWLQKQAQGTWAQPLADASYNLGDSIEQLSSGALEGLGQFGGMAADAITSPWNPLNPDPAALMDRAAMIQARAKSAPEGQSPGLFDKAMSMAVAPQGAPESSSWRPLSNVSITQAVAPALRAAGITRADDPESELGRILKTSANYVGAAVPTAGMGGVSAPLLLTQAGASGAIAQTAKEAGMGPGAQMGLSLLPSLAAPAISNAYRRAKELVGPVRDTATRVNAGEYLLDAIDEPGVYGPGNTRGQIDRAAATAGATGDSVDDLARMRSTAEQTNNPRLMELETGLRGEGGIKGEFAKRDIAREGIRRKVVESIGGADDLTAESVQNAVAKKLGRFESGSAAKISSAQKRAAEAKAAIGRPVSSETTGSAMRTAVKTPFDKSREAAEARFKIIDPKNKSRLPLTSVRKTARKAQAELFRPKGKELERETSKFLDKLYDQEVTHDSIRDLQDRRSEALSITEDLRNKGKSQDVKLLTEITKSLTDVVDEQIAAGNKTITPEMKQQWQAATTGWRKHKETFGRGTVAEVSQTAGYSGPKVDAGNVPGRFFVGGPAGKARSREFIKATGDPAKAEELIREHVATRLIDKKIVDSSGIIKPDRLADFITDHREALTPYRGLTKSLKDASKAQQLVDHLALKRAGALKAFEKSGAGAIIDVEPERVAARLLGRRDAARATEQVARIANKAPETRAALKRAFVDHLVEKTTNAQGDFKSATLDKFIRTNRRALSKVFSADEIEQFSKVAKDLLSRDRVQYVGSLSRNIGSPTSMNLSVAQWLSRSKAGKIAKLGNHYVGLADSMRGWQIGQRNRMLMEAALDPRVAQSLLKQADAKTVRRFFDLVSREGSLGAMLAASKAGENRGLIKSSSK